MEYVGSSDDNIVYLDLNRVPSSKIAYYPINHGESWLKATSCLRASEGITVFSDRLLQPFVKLPPDNKNKSTQAKKLLRPFTPFTQKAREQLSQWGDFLDDNRPPSIAESFLQLFPHRCYWAAFVEDKVVARLALFARNKNEAFFGFFYVEEGYRAEGCQMLTMAASHAKKTGFPRLRGPISFHPMLGAGILTGGNGSKPVLYQPHNRETRHSLDCFYEQSSDRIDRIEGETWGWRESYRLPVLLEKMSAATKTHEGLRFRNFDAFNPTDIDAFIEVYNNATQDAPGFIPLTTFEAKWAFQDTITIEPECSLLAELNGEPIAALISAQNLKPIETMPPDEAVGEIPRRIWFNLLGRKACLRVLSFGVKREYRGAAVGSLPTTLWHEMLRRAINQGYDHIITPVIDVTDHYRINANKLLMLRPERRVVQYIIHLQH